MIEISSDQLIRAAEALIAKNTAVITLDPDFAEMDAIQDAEYRKEVASAAAQYRPRYLQTIWEGFIRPVVGQGDPDEYAFEKWQAEWDRIVGQIEAGQISVDDLLTSLEARTPLRSPEA